MAEATSEHELAALITRRRLLWLALGGFAFVVYARSALLGYYAEVGVLSLLAPYFDTESEAALGLLANTAHVMVRALCLFVPFGLVVTNNRAASRVLGWVGGRPWYAANLLALLALGYLLLLRFLPDLSANLAAVASGLSEAEAQVPYRVWGWVALTLVPAVMFACWLLARRELGMAYDWCHDARVPTAVRGWRRGLAYHLSGEQLAELDSHMSERVEELTRAGNSTTVAWQDALRQMGPAAELRDEFAKNASPLRAERLLFVGLGACLLGLLEDLGPILSYGVACTLAPAGAGRMGHLGFGLVGLLATAAVTYALVSRSLSRWIAAGRGPGRFGLSGAVLWLPLGVLLLALGWGLLADLMPMLAPEPERLSDEISLLWYLLSTAAAAVAVWLAAGGSSGQRVARR